MAEQYPGYGDKVGHVQPVVVADTASLISSFGIDSAAGVQKAEQRCGFCYVSSGCVRQVLQLNYTAAPTGGTFTVSYNGSAASAGLAYNIAAAALQTAIEGLSTVGAGNVTVTGGPFPASPFKIIFSNALAQGAPNPWLVADTSGLTGGTAVSAQVSALVKAGAGHLFGISIEATAGQTMTLYDSVYAGGNVIAAWPVSGKEGDYLKWGAIAFQNGLVLATTGAYQATVGFN